MSSAGTGLFEAFERLRRRAGDAPAVVDERGGVRISRDQLARLVDRAGAALAPVAPGATTHSAVALRMPNGAELVAAVLACWRAGQAPLLIDAELADAEARECCHRLGIDRALGEPSFRWRALGEPDRTPSPLPEGTALLKLTSGTTGEPRAVAVAGAALEAGARQIASTMGIEAADRNLVAIPLVHSYGFDNVVLLLATLGCPAVLVHDLTPRSLFGRGRAARATVFPAVPFLLDVLSRAPSAAGARWPELRLVISAGAPLPIETRERFAARFGLRPRTFYGATECGGIAFDRAAGEELPEGCVGSALDGVAIELLDVDAEGAGRVRVRSASAASGYLPEEGEDGDTVLERGTFLTADVGRLDDRGRLHLLGRVGDVINVAGRKVYPAEVERVIRRIEGVREVAVVAVERSAVAEGLRAIVVARLGIDRASILRACEAELARYKVPRSIELRDELPRTTRGKLDRRRLGR